jgi:hypothetical protein
MPYDPHLFVMVFRGAAVRLVHLRSIEVVVRAVSRLDGSAISRTLLSHCLCGCCLIRPALLAAAVHDLRLIASTPIGFRRAVFVPVRP